ncbi:hypothetical protein F2P81_023373 [Scophthalmus maximus]|uniref:Uncharacterized protein n=1 Tax=Scophthalmus maximus TaxID=52904 RepID=A0A6A4S050_SCOMX|nr:hypothetical protein F2P81_023373 [Scophthalmus maximus]
MSTKPKPKCSHGDLFVCTSQKNAKRSTVRHDRLVLNACLRSLSSAFQELLPPNWSDFFSRHRGNGDLILWDRAATPSVKQTAYAKDP